MGSDVPAPDSGAELSPLFPWGEPATRTRNPEFGQETAEFSRGENRPIAWGEPARLGVIPWGEPAKLLIRIN